MSRIKIAINDGNPQKVREILTDLKKRNENFQPSASLLESAVEKAGKMEDRYNQLEKRIDKVNKRISKLTERLKNLSDNAQIQNTQAKLQRLEKYYDNLSKQQNRVINKREKRNEIVEILINAHAVVTPELLDIAMTHPSELVRRYIYGGYKKCFSKKIDTNMQWISEFDQLIPLPTTLDKCIAIMPNAYWEQMIHMRAKPSPETFDMVVKNGGDLEILQQILGAGGAISENSLDLIIEHKCSNKHVQMCVDLGAEVTKEHIDKVKNKKNLETQEKNLCLSILQKRLAKVSEIKTNAQILFQSFNKGTGFFAQMEPANLYTIASLMGSNPDVIEDDQDGYNIAVKNFGRPPQ